MTEFLGVHLSNVQRPSRVFYPTYDPGYDPGTPVMFVMSAIENLPRLSNQNKIQSWHLNENFSMNDVPDILFQLEAIRQEYR